MGRTIHYVTFFVSKDTDRVKLLQTRLKTLGYDGKLFNELDEFHDRRNFNDSQQACVDKLMTSGKPNKYILFCVSNNFPDTNNDDTMSRENGQKLWNWLYQQKRETGLFLPVFLDKAKDIKPGIYQCLTALNAYKHGLDINATDFEEKARKALKRGLQVCMQKFEYCNMHNMY